jgi:hypothetical protein
MTTQALPEFMVRVKLPSSSAYAACPSGDAEYEEAYKKAIFDVKPAGFEVSWPRLNEKWPVDSEGYTWVRLFCADQSSAIAQWIGRVDELQTRLETIRRAAGQ